MAESGQERSRGGRLRVVGLTDAHSIQDVIWPGFEAAVGRTVGLDYTQDVVQPRVAAALRGEAGPRPDLAIVASPPRFDRGGLLAVASIDRPAGYPDGWLDSPGRWWPIYVQPIVAIYNELRVTAPRAWLDLADADLQDRIVFEEPRRMLTTGPALADLSTTLGDGWQPFVASLAAGRPHLVGDNERAVLEVATGSRWVGLSNWNVARRVRPGSPVRHVLLDPTPCVPAFVVLAAGATNRDLAERFIEWLVSPDGQAAYARTGRIPAMPAAGGELALDRVLEGRARAIYRTVDWLERPGPWLESYEAAFGPVESPRVEGKLR